jgi:RNA polymerase sigma-70 factor (ECF subfamily)
MWNSDRWLVRRTLAGDRDAFGRLYDRHAPRVFHLLRRLMGSAAEAEDLTQDTFLAAYQALSAWRGEGAFSTYLCGIAFRQYGSVRRRSLTTEPLEETLPTFDSHADPLAHCTRREAEEAVDAAIAALPPLSREVFVLIRVEELTYKEAAALLDVPVGTVQSRLWRATQLLQAELTPLLRGHESPAIHCPKEGADHAVR